MILLVGATGDLGGRVASLLRGQGYEIRALVRAQTDSGRLRALGAEVVTGDLTDATSLAAACRDVDVVVATATSISRGLAGQRHPTMREVDDLGMCELVRAADAAHVSHFVHVSMAGLDRPIDFPLKRAKRAVESQLSGSSMGVSIVRPDGFQDVLLDTLGRFDLARARASIIGTGDTPQRLVACADVAALIVSLAGGGPAGVIEFGGPDALSRNEIVRLAEQVTARPFKVSHLPRPAARAMSRALAGVNPSLSSVLAMGVASDLYPATWDEGPLVERGIKPRSVRAFLEARWEYLSQASRRTGSAA